HSLGGLVARHLVELGNESRVRRLVTLGAPYYSERRPSRELAIFAADDLLVPPPADARGRGGVVEDCGHLNLLRHPRVLRAVARFLVHGGEELVGGPQGGMIASASSPPAGGRRAPCDRGSSRRACTKRGAGRSDATQPNRFLTAF